MDDFLDAIPEKIPHIIRFSHNELRCNQWGRTEVYFLKRMYENSDQWDVLDKTRVQQLLKNEGIIINKKDIKKLKPVSQNLLVWNRCIRFEVLIDRDISTNQYKNFFVGDDDDYMDAVMPADNIFETQPII